MVSLKTIAERCGVSTATVSKALNDHKDISEETKNRVKQTAEALGYFPNAAARALKTNRSYNIGVLFEEEAGRGLTHEYFSGVLNGLKIQAEKLGYDITFINTCFENRKMSYYEHCRYRNFEGVVIVCANFDDPDVIELMNSEIPVVTIDYVHHNCTAVTSNNIQGMEDLVKYIYSQGLHIFMDRKGPVLQGTGWQAFIGRLMSLDLKFPIHTSGQPIIWKPKGQQNRQGNC